MRQLSFGKASNTNTVKSATACKCRAKKMTEENNTCLEYYSALEVLAKLPQSKEARYKKPLSAQAMASEVVARHNI